VEPFPALLSRISTAKHKSQSPLSRVIPGQRRRRRRDGAAGTDWTSTAHPLWRFDGAARRDSQRCRRTWSGWWWDGRGTDLTSIAAAAGCAYASAEAREKIMSWSWRRARAALSHPPCRCAVLDWALSPAVCPFECLGSAACSFLPWWGKRNRMRPDSARAPLDDPQTATSSAR
jgi:hypothetical protein